MLVIFSQEEIVLPKGNVGEAEEIFPCVVAAINDNHGPRIPPVTSAEINSALMLTLLHERQNLGNIYCFGTLEQKGKGRDRASSTKV
jgi:hypothetical protein